MCFIVDRAIILTVFVGDQTLFQVEDGDTDEEKELDEAKGNLLLVSQHAVLVIVGHS